MYEVGGRTVIRMGYDLGTPVHVYGWHIRPTNLRIYLFRAENDPEEISWNSPPPGASHPHLRVPWNNSALSRGKDDRGDPSQLLRIQCPRNIRRQKKQLNGMQGEPEKCPISVITCVRSEPPLCSSDADCFKPFKCCFYNCQKKCVLPHSFHEPALY
ncbi:hypothetical protein NDU88_011651 [Pleurodeles waltl]|uniref:WAP domain-containing protein n=1 Tax=Pleurodeles waltl TaxID=8319 RepID=A0AAV7S398_PLEWA|nr:hypothetical protein NDU88_011651 [Pleurodeles waltl]